MQTGDSTHASKKIPSGNGGGDNLTTGSLDFMRDDRFMKMSVGQECSTYRSEIPPLAKAARSGAPGVFTGQV